MIKFLVQCAITFMLGRGLSAVAYQADLFAGDREGLTPVFIIALIAYRIAFIAGVSPIFARVAGVAAAGIYLAFPVTYLIYTPKLLLWLGVLAAFIVLAPRLLANRNIRREQNLARKKEEFKTADEVVFKSSHFTLTLDFKADTVRLVAGKADKVKTEGESASASGKFDRTVALYQLLVKPGEIRANEKSVYVQNTAVSFNSTIGSTHHTLPGGSFVNDPTGTSKMSITLRDDYEATNARGLPFVAHGGPRMAVLEFDNVPDADARRFKEFWFAVKDRVEQSYKAFSDDIETRSRALSAEAAKAEVQRLRQVDMQVEARLKQMIADAGMTGDFLVWSSKEDRLHYFLSADRTGKAIIMVGEEQWQGSLNGAKARIVPASQRENTAEHLEIEVKDAQYEEKNLAKRRMRLLHGAKSALLQEWSDRIDILGERSPVA